MEKALILIVTTIFIFVTAGGSYIILKTPTDKERADNHKKSATAWVANNNIEGAAINCYFNGCDISYREQGVLKLIKLDCDFGECRLARNSK